MKKKSRKLLVVAAGALSAGTLLAANGVASPSEGQAETVDGERLAPIEYMTDERFERWAESATEVVTDAGTVLQCTVIGNTKAPARHETCRSDEGDFFAKDRNHPFYDND